MKKILVTAFEPFGGRKTNPSLMIQKSLGETAIRIERFGLNIKDYRIKDNSGERPAGEKICVDGPAAYVVSIPPEKIVEELLEKNIPAYASSHAGTYVCNTLIYEAMRAIDEFGLNTKYLFVHFPLSTEEAIAEKPVRFPPTLPEKILKEAGSMILKHIAGNY